MFDKLEDKYIITGILRCTTGIFIGGNSNAFEPHAIDNIVIKDSRGLPFIPGSSLKGVLRSYLERVLRSVGNNVCMVPKLCSEKYNSKEKRKRLLESLKDKNTNKNETVILSQEIYNNLCEICHLFGSEVTAAKLSIRDLKIIEESFKGFEFRTGNSINRDKNKAEQGHLYEMEIVPADTLFDMKLVLENPDDKDLKNTVFLLKSMMQGDLSIGGKTSRGLGGFIIENINIQKISKDNIIDSLLQNKKDNIEIDDLLKEMEV